MTPTLSITAGVRYDWDGGLTEKYGNIFNFNPKQYSYDVASDTITSSGFIIAGNNANGTKGVSKTTLTGRQWGIAPRLGLRLAAIASSIPSSWFAAAAASTTIAASSSLTSRPAMLQAKWRAVPSASSQTRALRHPAALPLQFLLQRRRIQPIFT